MSILKSERPEYRVQLPITNKRVSFTAFNMRSERTLMMATTGGDNAEIVSAVVNTVDDHLRTEGIKAANLPQCEVELLILMMRAKSVGEFVELQVTDPDDGKSHPVKVELNKITIDIDPEFDSNITISDGRLVSFRLPGIDALEEFDDEKNEFDSSIDVFVRCFKSIAKDDECVMRDDLSENEIKDFFLDLDSGDFQLIVDKFFSRMPRLSTTVKVPRKDKEDLEVVVEGLASFL